MLQHAHQIPPECEASVALRARVYDAFGRFFLDGVADDLLLAEVPSLEPALRSLPQGLIPGDHLRAIWEEVSPYAGGFLNPNARPGGATAEGLAEIMRRGGFTPPEGSVRVDHLSVSLQYLAFLSRAEAAALGVGQEERALRFGVRARAFIELQLLSWLPPLLVGLDSVDPGRLGVVARRLLNRLVEQLAREPEPMPLPVVARPVRSICGQGLAVHLTSPVQSGAWLTLGWARSVGKQLGVSVDRSSRSAAFGALVARGAEHRGGASLTRHLNHRLLAVAERLEVIPCGAPWADRVYRTAHAVRGWSSMTGC